MHLLVLLATAALCVVQCRGACNVLQRGVNKAEQQTIVRKHNELRQKVATGQERNLPRAVRMPNMVWDDAVAQKAQAWAEKCKFEHDQASDRDTGRGYTGQNIAYSSNQDPNPDWAGIIQMFYNEVSKFDPSTIDKYRFDSATGHFTQIIWADTRRIGCGYVTYRDGGNIVHLYGCDYLPGGNIIGQRIYERVK